MLSRMEMMHRLMTQAESERLRNSTRVGSYRGVAVEYEVWEGPDSIIVASIPDGPSSVPVWLEAVGFASVTDAMRWVISRADAEVAAELS